MGATESKTLSSTDIANTFVATAIIKATNKNATTTNGSQSIVLSCTDAVKLNSDTLCEKAKSNFAMSVVTNPSLSTYDKTQLIAAYSPEVCSACEAGDISQDLGISITVSEINNNEVANKIKAELSSSIEEQLKNTQSGTIGYGKSDVESLTTIKNYVENKFDVNIVNESLKQFNFDQNINSTNMKVKNISQKMVANVVASSMVSNALSNDSELEMAVKKVTKAESVTTGVIDSLANMFGNIMIMYVIMFVVVAVIAYSLKLHCFVPPFSFLCAAQAASSMGSSNNDGNDNDDNEEE
jgi:hypothetical protein